MAKNQNRKVIFSMVLIFAVFVGPSCMKNISWRARMVPVEKVHSGFGYYGTSPENPSGTMICYVRFKERPVGRHGTKPAELWVCNSDLSGYKKLIDLRKCENHNTAKIQWVDDRRIAYMDDRQVFVIDANSKKVVLGPIDGSIGHNVYGRKILVQANSNKSDLGEKGLYEVDCNTGKSRFILRPGDLAKYIGKIHEIRDVNEWKFGHAQWSTRGSKISIRLTVGDAGERHNLLFTFAADGTDVVYFGPKPMHFLWFDDDTILGHDNQVNDGRPNDRSLRRWDRDAKFIETLAGPGNHTSASPDRQWFASESWYGTAPIELKLFHRGNVKPVATLMSHSFKPITWADRCHVNPSFSRDGNRVYFFMAVNENLAQACFSDISSYKK